MTFHKEIYTTTAYSTWLKHTNEKDLLLARLPAIFQRMHFSRPSPIPRRILGIGDGTGHTALRILQLLDNLQIPSTTRPPTPTKNNSPPSKPPPSLPTARTSPSSPSP